MKILILILLAIFPSKHIEQISVEFNTDQSSYFHNYRNSNFSQKVFIVNGKVRFHLKHFSHLELDLNYRIFPDKKYIKNLSEYEINIVRSLLAGTVLLKGYLKNISLFIKDNIRYRENSPWITPMEVLKMREANCIGFSSLTRNLMSAAGLRSKYVRGFYLKADGKTSYRPVPHRWLEISLPTGEKFFYDPQYQDFTANYIVMDGGVTFSNIRKFSIQIVRKTKKFMN